MKLHRAICTFSLFLLLLAAPAWAGDFSEPRPGLHTGGQPSEARLEDFAGQGVKTVIDLRGEGEDRGYDEVAATKRLGLRYERLPIEGAEDLTPANAARLKQLLESGGNQVLLHCASGNRVGALLALMAQQEEGATREQALELGRQAGMKSLTPVVEEKLQP
ncbi:fused DSP-PTPase phosphatase/NAD kinase-like protein [Pseudoxanthomonas indica]|uniref:TIGR01244 family protein n=1 Tax=Pseudoxanthomonas indica TaxID=428993 RepID=A0A1T5KW40_9GAMM|nr:sulfur transferase domain-containing protein [Pseudoxanthomonas indica]GGD51895.1 hypothetical protein GCM10007235_25140 [Pseudoxanthomonas indica]SKC67438.1 TIGR01244 family protein [Pseudoxanthomonas indica]